MSFLSFMRPTDQFVGAVFENGLFKFLKNTYEKSDITEKIKGAKPATVHDLDFDVEKINKSIFFDSPFKVIKTKIQAFTANLSSSLQTEITIDDLFIVICPSKNPDLIILPEKEQKKEEVKIPGSAAAKNLVSSVANTFLAKLKVTINNITVKIATYEDFQNHIDFNPTFTVLLQQIKYEGFGDKKNIASFILDNIITMKDFSVKLSQKFDKEEIFHYNLAKDATLFQLDENSLHKEKLYLLNNQNNTIVSMTQQEQNDYNALKVKISKTEDKKKMKIEINVTNFEVIVDPQQMFFIRNFLDRVDYVKKMMYQDLVLRTKSQPSLEEFDIMGVKFSLADLTFNLHQFVFVLNESKLNQNKLWTFLEYKYPNNNLDTNLKIQNHFGYLQDNFYIFILNKFELKSLYTFNKSNSVFDLSIDDIFLRYVIYKNSFPFSKKIPENLLVSYENFNEENVANMKNIDSGFYLGIYDSLFETDNKNVPDVLRKTNLSQFPLLNLDLNFDYSLYTHSLLRFNKNNEKNERINIKSVITANSITENDHTTIKTKNIISINIPEIIFEFHPYFLFNLTTLLSNNVMIINNLFGEEKFKQNQKLRNKGEILIVDEDKELALNKINTKIQEIKEFSEKIEHPTNFTVINKTNVLVDIPKIDLHIFKFKTDDLNSFLINYYKSNITPCDPMFNSNELKKEDKFYLEDSDKSSSFCISINQIRCLIKQNSFKKMKSVFLEFEQLNLLFKKIKDSFFPLINYKTPDFMKESKVLSTISDSKEFTESFKKEIDLMSGKWSIIFQLETLNNDRLNKFTYKELEYYYEYFHLTNFNRDKNEFIQEINKNENSENDTTHLKVFFKNSINICFNNSLILEVIDYFDNLLYTLNVHSCLAKSTCDINKRIKSNFLDFNIESNLEINKKANPLAIVFFEISEVNILNFNKINKKIQENESNDQSEIMSSVDEVNWKLNFSKINLNTFQYGSLSEFILSSESFKFIFKKPKDTENPEKNEENRFHHLIYKEREDLLEKFHMFTISSTTKKEKISIKSHGDFDNICYNDYEEFINESLTKPKSSKSRNNINAQFNSIVINPITDKIKIDVLSRFMIENFSDFSQYTSKIDKIGFNPSPRKSKSADELILSIQMNKILLDVILDSQNKTELQSKIRFIINFENTKIELALKDQNQVFSLELNKINFLLLKNLDILGAYGNLINRAHLINKESPYFLSRIGFKEIILMERIFLKYENQFKEKSLNFEILSEEIELSFCRDSFYCTRYLIQFLSESLGSINKNIKLEPKQNLHEDHKLERVYTLEKKLSISYPDENLLSEHNIDKTQNQTIKIFFYLKQLKIFFIDGKDFKFSDEYALEVFEEDMRENDQQKIVYPNDDESNNEEIKKMIQKPVFERKCSVPRNFNNQITICIYEIESETKFDGSSIIPLTFYFQILKFEIEDNVESSKYKKIVSKYNFKNSIPFLYLKFDILNNSSSNFTLQNLKDNLKEVTAYFHLEPLYIMVDQNTLFFIFKFFKLMKKKEEVKEDKIQKEKLPENQKNDLLHKIFLRKIHIDEFFINFCYLTSSNDMAIEILEFLNLFSLKDMNLSFKKYEICNILLEDLFNDLLVFWLDDIKNNQKSNIFTSLGFIRPISSIIDSFIDILTLPFDYKEVNADFSETVAKSFQHFIINLSTESISAGEKVFDLLEKLFGESTTRKPNTFVKNIAEPNSVDQYLLK